MWNRTNAPQTHLTKWYVCLCCFRTQKDDSPQSPYLVMSYDGTVSSEDEMRVVSTCKMDVHKFPFDTQECNLTIGSAVHSSEFQVRIVTSMFFSKGLTPWLPVCPSTEDEMQFFAFSNASRATQFSREVMKTQGEWEFLQLSISTSNLNFQNKDWELLIYTVCNTQTKQRKKESIKQKQYSKYRKINMITKTNKQKRKSGTQNNYIIGVW